MNERPTDDPDDPWSGFRKAVRPSPDASARAWQGLLQRLEAGAPDPHLPVPPPLEDRPAVAPRRRVLAFAVGVAAAAVLLAVVLGRGLTRVDGSDAVAPHNQALDDAPRRADRKAKAPQPGVRPELETSEAMAIEEIPGTATAVVEEERGATKARLPESPRRRAAASTSSFDAELAFVQAARAALTASDPAKALKLMQAHARRYPLGHLGHERRATEIAALCALSRREEAERRARDFAEAFPSSSVARALADRACTP